MTAPIYLPKSVKTDGATRIDIVPAIVLPSGPTVAELNAATVVPFAGALTPDGWSPSGEQATVTDDRIASTQTFEQPGRKTKSLQATYVYNPGDPDENEAYLALAEGAEVFIVTRMAYQDSLLYTAAQKVDVFQVTAGEPSKNYNGANSVHTVTQKLFVTGPWYVDAVVAA